MSSGRSVSWNTSLRRAVKSLSRVGTSNSSLRTALGTLGRRRNLVRVIFLSMSFKMLLRRAEEEREREKKQRQGNTAKEQDMKARDMSNDSRSSRNSCLSGGLGGDNGSNESSSSIRVMMIAVV